jgi:uncharacterized repeat protein (TIGR02543 family)
LPDYADVPVDDAGNKYIDFTVTFKNITGNPGDKFTLSAYNWGRSATNNTGTPFSNKETTQSVGYLILNEDLTQPGYIIIPEDVTYVVVTEDGTPVSPTEDIAETPVVDDIINGTLEGENEPQDFIVTDVSEPDDEGIVTVTVKPDTPDYTYNVVDEEGTPVTPTEEITAIPEVDDIINGTLEGEDEPKDFVVTDVIGPDDDGVVTVTVKPDDTPEYQYNVVDKDGNVVTPTEEITATPEIDDVINGTLEGEDEPQDFIVTDVSDPDDEGVITVTVKPDDTPEYTYTVVDEEGNTVEPAEEITETPEVGDPIVDKEGKNWVVKEVSEPDYNNLITITVAPDDTPSDVTYNLVEEDGTPVTPAEDITDAPTVGDVIQGTPEGEDEEKPYVVKEVKDPVDGVADVIVVPVTYVAETEDGTEIPTSEEITNPKVYDVIEDTEGNKYTITDIGDPDSDTGIAVVTVIPGEVTYVVKDVDGNDVTPAEDITKAPELGDVIDDENGDKWVVKELSDPDDDNVVTITVNPLTYDVVDTDGNAVEPKEELKDPKVNDTIIGTNGKKYTIQTIEDPDPETGVSKVVVKKKASGGGGGGGDTMYTLTYDTNGGEDIKNESYAAGTNVNLSKVPVKEGFTFTGWFADKELETSIKSVTMSSNKTVYAGWKEGTEQDKDKDKDKDKDPVIAPTPDKLNGNDHFAYIVGYEDNTVRPTANITRAEVATIFFRLLKDDVRSANITKTNSFSDVKESSWYNTAVSTMANMGIISGYPDGTFKPNESITRAEFAAIAARFDAANVSSVADFSDIAGHWAALEISKAANNGWVSGYPDGTFRPNQKITRAEAMSLINRVLNRVPDSVDDLHEDMVTFVDNADTNAWYYIAVQEAANSHDYEKDADGETWTAIKAAPNWAAMEN